MCNMFQSNLHFIQVSQSFKILLDIQRDFMLKNVLLDYVTEFISWERKAFKF